MAAAAARLPLVTPEVKVDNTVTFRFRAPNAQAGHADRRARWQDLPDDQGRSRRLVGDHRPARARRLQLPVQRRRRDRDGPGQPGGQARVRRLSRRPTCSRFPGDEFDDARNVPHGTVRVETYHSKTMGVPRTLWIYTPPGYETGNTRYPVFYLLHGSGNTDIELDADRPRQLHPRQPDRRGEDEADDHRQSARLRAAGRQPRAGAAGGERADRARRRRSAAACSARICWTT